MSINEPTISKEAILVAADPLFTPESVCIVTGCATGIGRATAVAAAVNGLTTVGLDVNETEAEKTLKTATDFGGRMVFVKCDLTDDADIEFAVKKAAESGHIRYLANIAGLQHIDAVENFPMEKYDLMHRIMLRAPLLLSKQVIPHIKRSPEGAGAVGHMGSIHAHICTKNKVAYNITKFGLRALAASISAEGEGRVRSFTVSTGYVKTPLALNQIPDQAQSRGISQEAVVKEVMMGMSRVKEMMEPVDVANLFIFGFSRFAKYLVGGDLLFDGGVVRTY